MGKLDGKVALVTGGNSGMGLATAALFVKEGAKVIITGRRKKETDEAAASIRANVGGATGGASIEGIQSDTADLGDIDKLHAHISQKYGRLDVLFANAGIGSLIPLGHVPEPEYDRIFSVNVKGVFFTVQKLLPLIPDGGSIILNGSNASISGMEAFSVYSATKAAIRSFARTWTTDLKARKIRVNTLSPGPIETPIFGKAGLTSEQIDQFKSSLATSIPLGRMGHVDEIAKPALFLASDDSSFITGIELFVDGGMSQI